MRRVRIYQPGNYSTGDSIELSPKATQHVGVVLRMQPGEELILFSGENREFDAVITSLQRKKIVVTIQKACAISRESSRPIHLVQALSKGERMEWIVQKATELGVTSITPVITAHCAVKLDKVRLDKKLTQWRDIAIAACEQCGRNQFPTLAPFLFLGDYLQQHSRGLSLVLTPHSKKTWKDYQLSQQEELVLLIGPEGGFSKEELQQISTARFQSLSLGPRILRTETAAIAALSVLQAVFGDL